MPRFITPPKEEIEFRNRTFTNFPVNIDLVTGLEKTTHHVYSDGYWSVQEPVIKFHGTDILWHFGEMRENDRDLYFLKLMSEYGCEKYACQKSDYPTLRGKLSEKLSEIDGIMDNDNLHPLRIEELSCEKMVLQNVINLIDSSLPKSEK